MGRPVDRVAGVVLVTDYGALDRALRQRDRQAAEKAATEAKTEEWSERIPCLGVLFLWVHK